MLALKTAISRKELRIRKVSAGSVTILFSNNRKPLIVNNEEDMDLSSLVSKEDLLKSNLEWLVKKGFIKIVL